jgi:[lysine-biosynthesis-protein LysW]---L-2-aminoadipate ligase
MEVALLAERLRVEERLLIGAFAARGHQAVIVPPSQVQISLTQPTPVSWPLALLRSPASVETSALVALVASGGSTVINRPATARLLSERLALLRHLVCGGIPVPDTAVSFGEDATFAAIEQIGYPVLLKALTIHPSMPIALVEDRDAAEAIVEHRMMLGGEQAVLVQRFAGSQGRSERLAVVGRRLLGVESREHSGWRPGREAEYAPYEGDTGAHEALAQRLFERLGSGTYSVEVVESQDGICVVGAENLTDYRSLQERGVDVAGAIVDFALGQLDEEA